MTILSYIKNLFGITNNGPSGADAVRTAVQEFQDLAEREFTATLGEPDIIQQGGEFLNDPKVVVPVYDGPFGEVQRLVFDLPRGEQFKDVDEFSQLLELFALDIDSMEDLQGEQAPVRFVAGNLVVDWDQMDRPDSLDKGGEENPHTEEDVEEMSDEPNPESNSTDTQSDSSEQQDTSVNVEETTISAEGDDD